MSYEGEGGGEIYIYIRQRAKLGRVDGSSCVKRNQVGERKADKKDERWSV
jgi:hypothetical protein